MLAAAALVAATFRMSTVGVTPDTHQKGGVYGQTLTMLSVFHTISQPHTAPYTQCAVVVFLAAIFTAC